MSAIRSSAVRGAAVVLVGVLSLGSWAGCAGIQRTAYVDTQVDFSTIRRVAVLPFENMTQDQFAGEKVRRIFIIELLSKEVVEVADPAEVAHALQAQQVKSVESIGSEQLRALAEKLRADAVVLGSVHEFGVDRSGTVAGAQVSITFRMRDATGELTLWTASVTRSGTGAASRLFGVSGDTPTQASRKLVRKALATLVK